MCRRNTSAATAALSLSKPATLLRGNTVLLFKNGPASLWRRVIALCLFDAFDVFAGLRVDAENISRINKEGSENGSARFKRYLLVTTGCGVTLNRRRCFRHLE